MLRPFVQIAVLQAFVLLVVLDVVRLDKPFGDTSEDAVVGVGYYSGRMGSKTLGSLIPSLAWTRPGYKSLD